MRACPAMQRITRMLYLSRYEEGLQCTWRAGPSTGAWRAHLLTCLEDQVCAHLLGRCERGWGTSGKFCSLRDIESKAHHKRKWEEI